MKILLVILLVVVLIPSANAQYKSLELTDTTVTTKPTLKLKEKPSAGEELIGQFFGGNLGGIALGFGTGYVGYLLTKRGHGHWDGAEGLILGFVAGHCAGSIIGVYGIGSSKNFTGDVGSTILGGVLGTGAGIGTLFIAPNEVVAWSTLAFPTVGAMVGFNSTLRYKTLENNNKSELKDLGSQLKIKNDFEMQVLKVNFTLPKESEISKIPERFLLSLR